MEVFFFEPVEYERLYNCSTYSTDQTPAEQRQHLLIGSTFLIIATILEILYIPCMVAIRKHMDNTCYILMFYIAITDMMCLLMCGIVTGYLAIVGAVFCSAPSFIYIMGACGLALWITETTAEMFLAINRCVELCSARLAELLFHGKRIYLWMIFPTVYGLYMFTFTEPILFSALHVTWFLNPHIGYISDGTVYRNDVQSVHDIIVITVLPGIYLLFALILFIKGRLMVETGTHSMVSQKKIFVQVVLISSVNAIASAIYVLMNYVPLSEFLLLAGQFCWILAHGIPPIIYLVLNKTVRRDVYAMLVRPITKLFPCIMVPSSAGLFGTSNYGSQNTRPSGVIATNQIMPTPPAVQ